MKETLLKIKQFRVLYIEDDPKIAEAVLHLYKSIFQKVYYCNNAKEALETFVKKQSKIDLIVVEAHLQDVSGTQFISQIQKMKNIKQAIVFTINNADDNIILKCLKLGATDYLIKPFQHNTHLKVLLKVLKPVFDTKKVHQLNQELGIYKQYADKQLLISKTNLEGVITFANDNFCEISQYDKEELIGQPHNIVRHPNMPKIAFKRMWNTIQSGNIWNGMVQNKSKHGNNYFVESNIFPIKDSDDTILEYISFRQDITHHVEKNNKTKDMLKQTKLNHSKMYDESIDKARIKVAKELNNYEFSLNLERENSVKQTKKRALAENQLNTMTDLKDKEIKKWQDKLKLAGKTIENLNVSNKKLITDSRGFTDKLDNNNKKYKMSKLKIQKMQDEIEKLEKRIEDKDDVIKHLEEEGKKPRSNFGM